MQAIALTDALGTMGIGDTFHIKFITYDANRKTGGKVIELSQAFKVGAKHNQKNNETITVKQHGNTHHPHAVHIHLITEFNHQKVFI
jgi:hypothetical protein